MYALAEQRNFCLEKMVYKLGIVLILMTVFSGGTMRLDANESVIKYYIHENIIKKEHSNALFLLRQEWMNSLKEKYGNYKINEIENGIVYVKLNKRIGKRNIKINVAEINRNVNPEIEIIPQMTFKMHSRSRINNIVSDAKIAINGTYFKQDTGTPLGVLVINDEIVTGPIYERAALGIGEKEFKTSRVSFEGSLNVSNKTIKIDNINQPRMLSSYVLIYTPLWGEKAPAIKPDIINIAVKENKILDISRTSVKIPSDGYVISAPKKILPEIKIGDFISTKYGIKPEWNEIGNVISGGPFLLKNGKIFIDVTGQKLNGITGLNPRTAVGYTKDSVMIMVTVEGRKEGSSGVTLRELAAIMQDLGCIEAINLDGGSSTVMYVDGNVLSGTSLKYSSSINNALTVRIKET